MLLPAAGSVSPGRAMDTSKQASAACAPSSASRRRRRVNAFDRRGEHEPRPGGWGDEEEVEQRGNGHKQTSERGVRAIERVAAANGGRIGKF